MHIVTPEIWTLREKVHADKVSPIANAFLERRGLGLKHPVYDFLFTYYSHSPTKLKQWTPAIDESLSMTPQLREEYPWLTDYWFLFTGSTLTLNKNLIKENTRNLARFIADLCGNILQRSPRLNCLGLHEWAMVYKSTPENLRHKGKTLRLSHDELNRFVESQKICCSHYDAYRFFTKEAHHLNVLNPRLETRLQMEQGGCVHANMDLYKWSTKLWPWIGADFILKTFFLALEGRELDMRAGPYDLNEEGFEPICIETEKGRLQYRKEQQQLAEKAQVLRKELQEFCLRLA